MLWLKYNLFMLLLYTRGLVCKGIFIMPFGPILNTVQRKHYFQRIVIILDLCVGLASRLDMYFIHPAILH